MFRASLRRPLLAGILAVVVLASCSKEPPLPPVATNLDVGNSGKPAQRRPSAPLGLYVSLFLAQNGFIPSTSAVLGAQALTKFVMPQHPLQAEETFTLLEEFGTVLQVDIADMLNRSQNRPETLNAYMEGFANITERVIRKEADLKLSITQLQAAQKTAQARVRELEKSINAALKLHDYGTAGSLQQDLSTAQTSLAQVSTELTQTSEIGNTYSDLITLAEKRREAIESNREVLIAGLKVVNVPGIEDLGIINNLNNNRTRSRSPTLGF